MLAAGHAAHQRTTEAHLQPRSNPESSLDPGVLLSLPMLGFLAMRKADMASFVSADGVSLKGVLQAVKRINAQHRLILSGTPIQNNVLELWALFDFLMPGFLGTHAAFSARYGKALAAAKGSRTGSPEAQAGLLAMESLHKQARTLLKPGARDGNRLPENLCVGGYTAHWMEQMMQLVLRKS